MTAPFVPMTKEDVAAVLMCTTRTVENLVKSGGIPGPTLLAGRVFWHPDVFYSWLDSSLRGGPSERCHDVDAEPDLDKEPQPPIVKRGVRANMDSNSPTSRMKAAQAARMALSGEN
jgi:hypothetical protein